MPRFKYVIEEEEGGMFALYLRSRSGFGGCDLIARTRTRKTALECAERHANALKAYIEGRPVREQSALWRIYE